ncbi:MAG: GNAT family N-acetyltransferase [Gemmatimonadota bacterium]|nr:GNAT family N-acetyltransferase [Gemmatimonadota bacterium]
METRLERCTVRPWREEDVDALARHANDPTVWRNLRDRFPHPYGREDAVEWIERCRAEEPGRNFAIVVEGEAVGGIGLEPGSDVFRRTAEIGYWIARPHRGRGIATEALRAVTEYAFDAFDLDRLTALVFEWNPASARVLEKAGYSQEGRMRRAVVKEDRVGDVLVYGRLADEPREEPT